MRDAAAPALPAMIAAALPPACVTTLEAILAARAGRLLDVDRLALRLGRDREGTLDALNEAEGSFKAVFGLHVLTPQRAWFEDTGPKPDAVPDGSGMPDRVALGAGFVDLLDRPPGLADAARQATVVDRDSTTWIAAVAAAVAGGERMHLALRCRRDGDRDQSDLAALLARAGLGVILLEAGDRALAAALLRAELHAGDRPAVIVVATGGLLDDRHGGDSEGFDLDEREPGQASSFALSAMPWLKAMGGVCIWCVPHDAVLPSRLEGLIAGCIGPIRPEASWSREIVAAAIAPDVGPAGIAAIAGSLEDPREASARGCAARAVRRTGMSIDDACAFVARSVIPSEATSPVVTDFDLELASHDEEIALLHSRAREMALAGGRVLFHGESGSGKSTLAQAIASKMEESGAAGPALIVSAAVLLVKSYGGTERLLAQLWRRAEIARSPLIIDEIDAMCGVRDPGGSSSGNAYLVRCLTDEFIRRFDAHPGVTVLATCNDVLAVDRAILRRFPFQHLVAGELPPRLERRAWTSILGMDPPPRWTPCGASPSDFASAKARCRMLGLEDAAAYAAAVERARDSRRGPRPSARKPMGSAH